MKIMVTGHTGLLGKELTSQLKSAGHQVSGFSRSAGANISSLAALRNAMHRIDCVIHTAALLEGTPEELYETNVLGTRNVIAAAEENKVKSLVFVSSFEVLNKPAQHTEYGKTKVASEKIVQNCTVKKKTIVRPVFILGPNKYWQRYFDSLKTGLTVGNKKMFLPLIDYRDCASAIVFLLKNDSGTYTIGPERTEIFEKFYRIVCEELQIPEKPLIPVFIAKLANRILKKVPQKNLERFTLNKQYSSEKLSFLGWKPRYSLRESLKHTFIFLLHIVPKKLNSAY